LVRSAAGPTYLALDEEPLSPARAGARGARGRKREFLEADRTLLIFDETRMLARRAAGRGDAQTAAELEDFAWRVVRAGDPVTLRYAERVLGVSNPTVRDWVRAGLLEDFAGSPQRVGLESLARTREIVRELRQAGQDRELMAAVMSRLEWEELQQDDRFRESVGQMKRGERAGGR
jgi:hypothetical protein